MHNAMRRTLGVGGAAAVALAASLALAGVADAHTPTFSTGCLDNGQAYLKVDLQYYSQGRTSDENNTLGITYTPDGGKTQTVLATRNFGTGYPASLSNQSTFPVDGTTAGTFDVVVTAWDDPNGDHSVAKVGKGSAWDGTFTLKTTVCPQTGTTTPVPPTSPAPPTETTTSSPTTTTPVVAPVANQTPPTAKPGLAYTGVSATLPLIIGGVLIVLGAGALIAMRVMKRRRAES